MKLVELNKGRLSMYCPACEVIHEVPVSVGTPQDWKFNGDYEKPTLTPSLLVTAYNEKKENTYTCHSFIRNGQWQYLSDCTHEMGGMTVDLPDLELQTS